MQSVVKNVQKYGSIAYNLHKMLKKLVHQEVSEVIKKKGTAYEERAQILRMYKKIKCSD